MSRLPWTPTSAPHPRVEHRGPVPDAGPLIRNAWHAGSHNLQTRAQGGLSFLRQIVIQLLARNLLETPTYGAPPFALGDNGFFSPKFPRAGRGMALISLAQACLVAPAFWLQGEGDPEEIEGALLEWGRRREFVELDRGV